MKTKKTAKKNTVSDQVKEAVYKAQDEVVPCTLVRETEKAILVRGYDYQAQRAAEFWMPKSQIWPVAIQRMDSEIQPGFIAPCWLMNAKRADIGRAIESFPAAGGHTINGIYCEL